MSASRPYRQLLPAYAGSWAPPGTYSPRYLRHRRAVEEAHREQARATRVNRVVLVAVVILLYFAIGRDLLGAGRAAAAALSTKTRRYARMMAPRAGDRIAPAALRLTSAGAAPSSYAEPGEEGTHRR